MTCLGDLLVMAAPARPGEDLLGLVRGCPEEPDEQAADLRDGDRDVVRAGRPPFFRAPILRAARASKASVTCRYQPCRLRTA